jgi:hypothetical protein
VEPNCSNDQEIPFNFPLFNEDAEDFNPPVRKALEPIPPKRIKQRRKSIYGKLRTLQHDEYVGRKLLTSPPFWETFRRNEAKIEGLFLGCPSWL